MATLVGASPKEIVFTSGATESNNIATKGVAHFYKGKKRHIITTQTDHKCVLDSCRYLQQEVRSHPGHCPELTNSICLSGSFPMREWGP